MSILLCASPHVCAAAFDLQAISPIGLKKFPKGKYAVSGDDAQLPAKPMAIMLRSHKLQVGLTGKGNGEDAQKQWKCIEGG